MLVAVCHTCSSAFLIQDDAVPSEHFTGKTVCDVFLELDMLHKQIVKLGVLVTNAIEELLTNYAYQLDHGLSTDEGIKLFLFLLKTLIHSRD